MSKKLQLKSATQDFRTYEPEIVIDEDGSTVIMRKCEELVDGRWEPFYAIEKKSFPETIH
jgi:hypothetical protein